MEGYSGDNKLVITTEPQAFHFDLAKKADNDLKHKIDSIITDNEPLAEFTTKNEILKSLYKYNHGNDIHEHRKQEKLVNHIIFFLTCHKDQTYEARTNICSSILIYLLHMEKK